LINWSADPISSYYQEEIATSSAGKGREINARRSLVI